LGDGTSSNQVELSHLYAAAGTYQVSLTVTNNDGLSGSATQLVQVTNNLPVAVINDLAASYPINQSIAFNASASSDSDGYISLYEWDFGNGATATGETVDYAYASAGDYIVTLTLTDNAGGMNSATVSIQITDPNVLNAPSSLSASVEAAIVTLNWLDNSSTEDHFIIERGVKYRGKLRFEQIATLSADSTTFQDAVPDSGEYSYRVKAVNSYDEAYSDTIKVTVDTGGAVPPEPEPGAMSAPSKLSAVQTGALVELNWQDNSSDELGFYIERGEKTKGQIQFSRIAVVVAGISSFADDVSSLASGNYAYRVQAYQDGEVSDFSNVVELRIK
jgi:PKD repeat protein